MTRNWAITIGINHYRYLQPLRYGMSDADAVRQFFNQELQFHQIYHFTDISPPISQDYGPDLVSQPTSTTLGRFLRKRFEEPFLQTGDNLWFFFAGHGVRHENRDYLMPIDGDREDLERSAIPLNYVGEQLQRSGADNVIMLIDACRNEEGRRDGVGFGEEKQQGVITLYSCSPQEAAYEIEELNGGAFTHILLESLRLQGEGNCATVERLYQRLRYYVPQLTRNYRRMPQTPYGRIEPPSKSHLILLPQQATLTDVIAIKNDALKAEIEQNFETARHLWVRVLIVSPGDSEAVSGIERLSRETRPSRTVFSPTSIPARTTNSSALSSSFVHWIKRFNHPATLSLIFIIPILIVFSFSMTGSWWQDIFFFKSSSPTNSAREMTIIGIRVLTSSDSTPIEGAEILSSTSTGPSHQYTDTEGYAKIQIENEEIAENGIFIRKVGFQTVHYTADA